MNEGSLNVHVNNENLEMLLGVICKNIQGQFRDYRTRASSLANFTAHKHLYISHLYPSDVNQLFSSRSPRKLKQEINFLQSFLRNQLPSHSPIPLSSGGTGMSPHASAVSNIQAIQNSFSDPLTSSPSQAHHVSIPSIAEGSEKKSDMDLSYPECSEDCTRLKALRYPKHPGDQAVLPAMYPHIYIYIYIYIPAYIDARSGSSD